MPPGNRNSTVSYTKTTLSYPIFAADFDPYNRGYLVVGGGGGEGRSGVPNQISVLDVSNRREITTAADITLSRDEDSVQSLASLAKPDGLIAFAGINSSQADQDAGKNEHLRSFAINYPPRKKQKTEEKEQDDGGEGSVTPLGKRTLFKAKAGPKAETYQRLVRLSPARKDSAGSKRIGAIATGLAKDSEVVVFNATNTAPDEADVIARLQPPTEVNDLDIAEPIRSEFSVCYCTDYDIYEQLYAYDFTTKKVEKTPKGPRRIYQTPAPAENEASRARPKFRALRFLNAHNVAVLANKPNRSGSELRVFHLYPTGPAALVLQKTLPSHFKQAVSMDVCTLDADKDGHRQIAVAVAGQDISIEVFTVNYNRHTDTFSPFRPYLAMRDVHPQQITKICFSPFHSPSRSISEDGDSKAEKVPPQTPQYIRLASVSYGNTVVVDTFPLQPLDPQKPSSRYVLSHPTDEKFAWYGNIGLISLAVLVAAILLQPFIAPQSAPAYGLTNLLPTKVPGSIFANNVPLHHQQPPNPLPTDIPGRRRLLTLLREHHAAGPSDDGKQKALIVRHEQGLGLTVDVHPDKAKYLSKDTDAKHWDELSEGQRSWWREQLVNAGEWTEHEGEKILKSILFSEYAGFVGHAAREAMRG
ncbi:hypothetical protein MBLNU230_g2174t1 [Neophaeotheca triangularis]